MATLVPASRDMSKPHGPSLRLPASPSLTGANSHGGGGARQRATEGLGREQQGVRVRENDDVRVGATRGSAGGRWAFGQSLSRLWELIAYAQELA